MSSTKRRNLRGKPVLQQQTLHFSSLGRIVPEILVSITNVETCVFVPRGGINYAPNVCLISTAQQHSCLQPLSISRCYIEICTSSDTSSCCTYNRTWCCWVDCVAADYWTLYTCVLYKILQLRTSHHHIPFHAYLLPSEIPLLPY